MIHIFGSNFESNKSLLFHIYHFFTVFFCAHSFSQQTPEGNTCSTVQSDMVIKDQTACDVCFVFPYGCGWTAGPPGKLTVLQMACPTLLEY